MKATDKILFMYKDSIIAEFHPNEFDFLPQTNDTVVLWYDNRRIRYNVYEVCFDTTNYSICIYLRYPTETK